MARTTFPSWRISDPCPSPGDLAGRSPRLQTGPPLQTGVGTSTQMPVWADRLIASTTC